MRYLSIITSTLLALAGTILPVTGHAAPPPFVLELLERETDDMLGITWYRDPSQTDPLGTQVRFYFGMKRGKLLPLRLKVQYQGDHWVFARHLLFKVDGRLISLAPSPNAWNRENDGGLVWESLDLPASVSPTLVSALANAKSVKVRFNGKYVDDHELSDEDVAALRNVYMIWRTVNNPVDKQARAFVKAIADKKRAEEEEAARSQVEIDAATEAARADRDKPGWKGTILVPPPVAVTIPEPDPEKRAAFDACIEAAGTGETDASLVAQTKCYELLH